MKTERRTVRLASLFYYTMPLESQKTLYIFKKISPPSVAVSKTDGGLAYIRDNR